MHKDETKLNHIFLADDDVDDCSFFEEALQEVNIPTALTIANNGVELMNALETVTEPPPPHVIFLDLNMPRKNGFECLKEIRENDKLKNIPIIIFSTTANDDTIERAYSLGANCFICKPSSHQLLKKTIETVLALDFWEQREGLPKEKFVLAIS